MESLLAEITRLRAAEKAAVERCCVAFEAAIGEGYRAPASKHDECAHGRRGSEDCIACYDEALEAAIATLRNSLPPLIEGQG